MRKRVSSKTGGLEHMTLADRVFRELYQSIISGQIEPGEVLPPRRELAERYNVSLSTVQEAVKGLKAVGLIDSRSGVGTWVREDALNTVVDPDLVARRLSQLGAREIYEARLVIEVALADLAACRATDEDIQAIWEAIESMKAHPLDDQAYVQADLQFHLRVARAAHNRLLEEIHQLVYQFLPEVFLEMVKLPSMQQDGIDQQAAIALAIEERDRESAARRTAEQLHYYLDRLKELGLVSDQDRCVGGGSPYSLYQLDGEGFVKPVDGEGGR